MVQVTHSAARDNVLIEVGLFMGRFGVCPASARMNYRATCWKTQRTCGSI
jgi:hypothetical protein